MHYVGIQGITGFVVNLRVLRVRHQRQHRQVQAHRQPAHQPVHRHRQQRVRVQRQHYDDFKRI